MTLQPAAEFLFVDGADTAQHENETVKQGQVVHAFVQKTNDHGVALGPGRIIPIGGAPLVQ